MKIRFHYKLFRNEMRVILVLSCPSIIDNKPAGMILGRLEKAVELWQQLSMIESEDLLVITSGGTGSGKRKFPSSSIMRRYLIERGIPSNHIIEDPQAVNTIDNVNNCNRILKQFIDVGFPIEHLFVVTSDFHIPRVSLLFDYLGKDIDKVDKTFIGTEKYHLIEELVKHYINEEIAVSNIKANKNFKTENLIGDK